MYSVYQYGGESNKIKNNKYSSTGVGTLPLRTSDLGCLPGALRDSPRLRVLHVGGDSVLAGGQTGHRAGERVGERASPRVVLLLNERHNKLCQETQYNCAAVPSQYS